MTLVYFSPELPSAQQLPNLGGYSRSAYAAANIFLRRGVAARQYQRLIQALRQLRDDAGLTQLDVAQRLGTYASYVSKCESGERRIDVVELAAFCRLYGVSLAEFLDSVGLK